MLVLRVPALALLGGLSFLLAHCSSSDTPSGAASGGSTATGGVASATGGAATTGGAASATGGASTGGAVSTGGVVSTGGAVATGGALATGGVGGATNTGGTGTAGSGTGGAKSTGGAGGAAAGSTSMTGGVGGAGGSQGGGTSGSGGTASGSFVVTSPDHADNAKFTMEYTCDAKSGMFGAGVNPELDWTGVPDNTKSFAITFIDTKIGESNAMGQHWAAWDLPAAARKLPKGTTALTGDLAGGKQTNKYLAPCPSGDDTYEFTVYALSTATLSVTGAEGTGVSNSPGVAKVLAALKAVTPLGTAKLHGTSGPKGK